MKSHPSPWEKLVRLARPALTSPSREEAPVGFAARVVARGRLRQTEDPWVWLPQLAWRSVAVATVVAVAAVGLHLGSWQAQVEAEVASLNALLADSDPIDPSQT